MLDSPIIVEILFPTLIIWFGRALLMSRAIFGIGPAGTFNRKDHIDLFFITFPIVGDLVTENNLLSSRFLLVIIFFFFIMRFIQ